MQQDNWYILYIANEKSKNETATNMNCKILAHESFLNNDYAQHKKCRCCQSYSKRVVFFRYIIVDTAGSQSWLFSFQPSTQTKKVSKCKKVRRQWELINNSFIIQIFALTFCRNVTTREKSNFSWYKIHDINFASIELQLHLHLQMDITFSHCCIYGCATYVYIVSLVFCTFHSIPEWKVKLEFPILVYYFITCKP